MTFSTREVGDVTIVELVRRITVQEGPIRSAISHANCCGRIASRSS